MSGFGVSPGDFYFVVTLIGKVVAAFRDNSQGALQQYSAFSAELELVSRYLDSSPMEETELVALWKETKTQCVDFAMEYASLDPTIIPQREKIWDWLWLSRQTDRAFNTVKWSLDGRQEATELQQKVVRIVHLASVDLGLQNRTSLRCLETFLKGVLDDLIECCKIIDEKLGRIQDDIRELSPMLRSQGVILWQKIEDVRLQPKTIAMMREIALESQAHSNESFSGNGNDCSNSTTMLQTDFSLPSSRFRKLPDLGDLNFNKAVDHLSRLASIIENQVMRQHGGLPPSAKSIISFIDHMCDTINRALVAAGKRNQKFEYPSKQIGSEEALTMALEEWDRFTEKAKNQCTRVSNTPSRTTITPGLRLGTLNAIDENTRSLDIPEFRPRLQGRVLKRWGPARIILQTSSFEKCKVTVSRPDPLTIVSMIEFEDESGIKTKHNIFPVLDSAQAGPQSDSLDLRSSFETLRIVQEWQLPVHNHPKREPVYVFRSEKDCLALQTEALGLAAQGRRVIFSAEVQHVANITNNHKSCVMRSLRIAQESDKTKFMFYWERQCPITNQENFWEFVEFRRSEFKIKDAKGKEKPQVVLKFADEVTEPNEGGNNRPHLFHRRTNSKELSRSPSSTATFSSSPPSPGIVSKETGINTFSTLSTATTMVDPRAKAKKAVKGLEITFYTKKDRDLFMERFEDPAVEVASSVEHRTDSNNRPEETRRLSIGQRLGSMAKRTSR